jgi:hypothetical protein
MSSRNTADKLNALRDAVHWVTNTPGRRNKRPTGQVRA